MLQQILGYVGWGIVLGAFGAAVYVAFALLGARGKSLKTAEAAEDAAPKQTKKEKAEAAAQEAVEAGKMAFFQQRDGSTASTFEATPAPRQGFTPRSTPVAPAPVVEEAAVPFFNDATPAATNTPAPAYEPPSPAWNGPAPAPASAQPFFAAAPTPIPTETPRPAETSVPLAQEMLDEEERAPRPQAQTPALPPTFNPLALPPIPGPRL